MNEQLDAEFEKADMVLAEALVGFQEHGVSQYVYGMALLEIGIAALVKLDEPQSAIIDAVQGFIDKSRSMQAGGFAIPRQ